MKKPNIALVIVAIILTIALGSVLKKHIFSKFALGGDDSLAAVRVPVRTPVRAGMSLSAQLSPNTPAKRIVTTSATQSTNNVVLGVYSVKSQGASSTLKYVNFTINTSVGGTVGSIASNVRLIDNMATYGVVRVSANEIAFTNLSINLPADQSKDLVLVADIVSGVNQVTASSTLIAPSMSAIDANGNVLITNQAVDVTANDITFVQTGLSIGAASASLGTAITQSNRVIGYGATFRFTMINNGTTDAYVSKAPALLFATSAQSSLGGAAGSSTLSTVMTSPDFLAGDTFKAYIVPAGASRTFTASGRVIAPTGAAQVVTFKITGIIHNTVAGSVDNPSSATARTIGIGLAPLQVAASF